VNGVRVDPISAHEADPIIEQFVKCGESHVVHFVPAHPIVLARKNDAYRALLNRGDLNVPDGMSVVWALRLNGSRAERVAGSDVFRRLCRLGVNENYQHYLFGGSAEVGERLRTQLEQEYPGIGIVGVESPPFRELSDHELLDVADRVKSTGADFLWIGLGVPKQDIIAEQLRVFGAAPVILCVGAAFDFLSGAKRRAPEWMQRSGLEWLHRLGSEPRRLWRRYLLGNPLFIAAIILDRMRSRRWISY
jgi:N-acetylglucosaminyldiphosphoundecaprenol N-acetyl-beta-D-mannosaminyltransferase